MADLSATFMEFNEKIKLSSTKKEQLKISRDSIRADIRKYFKENRDKHTVSFKGQGSYMMKTTIEPISGEFDVDDGVYIFGKEEDRPTPQVAHDWVYEAVEKRTNSTPKDKNTCVRVIYAKNYHVDLPIYYKTEVNENEFSIEGEIPELAHKSKGWIESDPYAFKLWFDEKSKNKPQIKRLVRYLKAWSDKKQNDNKTLRFPSGMIFTILAVENFSPDQRDDISLLETLKSIQNSIDDRGSFTASFKCHRPTTNTSENLLTSYSSTTTKDNFLNALNSFIISGNEAIEMKSKKDACAKWQKHMGDRFPCSNIIEDPEELARIFAFPDKIKTENKSA